MKVKSYTRLIFIFSMLVLAAGIACAVPDFTFIHTSDVHAPYKQSRITISEIAGIGPLKMTPYNITSDTPSFALVTGDLTEFGYGGGAWDAYLSYWKDVKIPVYSVSGNHDGTWDCMRNVMRDLYGSYCYSFDKFGCHFIGLDTATPQDPRPGISLEQLIWLKSDLRKVGSDTPVFVFLHHPLFISEFASMYERDRILDILRPYNVVLILAGHSHNHEYADVAGIDLVMGGTTSTADTGYNIVSIKDNILRIAYKKTGETDASIPVLEKPLPEKHEYPLINISNPNKRETIKASIMNLKASLSGCQKPVVRAAYTIDNNVKGNLNLVNGSYTADIDTGSLAPGAHFIRVTFEDTDGRSYQKSTDFYRDDGKIKVIWRAFGSGSFKGAPIVTEDAVYAGCTDGKLYAFNRADGKLRWTYKTGGEIICQPAVTESGIYFGSGDCSIYGLDLNGKLKWVCKTKRPVYSSPVISGHMIVIGSNDPAVYALDENTGQLLWINTDPEYAIESKPFISRGTVYLGAWDKYLYALDLRTGRLKWRHPTQGVIVRNGSAERYYSPGDSGPVKAGNKVFTADRNYMMSIQSTLDGTAISSIDRCSSTALSEDGRYVYLRRTGGGLTKIDTDGNIIWNVKTAGADSVPSAPFEKDGLVYLASQTGRLCALSSADGSLLWEYQITPGLHVFGSIIAKDGIAYAAGMDGTITAVTNGSRLSD